MRLFASLAIVGSIACGKSASPDDHRASGTAVVKDSEGGAHLLGGEHADGGREPPRGAPAPKPVDLTVLPSWPVPEIAGASGSPVTVIAADADLDQLLVHTSPPGHDLVALATRRTVTGRISARTREAAYQALVALAPDPKAFAAAKLGTRGSPIDLEVAAMPAGELLYALAEHAHRNIVLDPRKAKARVDVRVRGAATDAVIERVAAALGLVPVDVNGTTLLWPPGELPAGRPDRRAGGPTVELSTREAFASSALEALRTVSPFRVRSPCGTGTPVTLRLRRVPLAVAIYAVVASSGVVLTSEEWACPPTPAPTTVPSDAHLVAVAGRGPVRVAVFALPAGDLTAKRPLVSEIGPDWVRFGESDPQRVMSMFEPPSWDLDPDGRQVPYARGAPPAVARITPTDWRLTATIEGDEVTAALFASSKPAETVLVGGGTEQAWTTVVGAGTVTIRQTDRADLTLPLTGAH